MKFEDTIQWKYDFYPTLYQERFQCLDHLFFTIGNGYDWKNGELFSEEHNYIAEFSGEGAIIGYKLIENYVAQLDEDERAIQRNKIESNKLKQNLARIHPHLFIKWYPLSKYSRIFSLPKNVKKDWEEGALEAIQLYQEDGNIFKLNGKLSLKIKKERKYYYIVMVYEDLYEKIFFNHDLIVSLLLSLTWEQYREKGLKYGGFIDEDRQLYFSNKRDIQEMLDDLESYLVMDRLVGK